MLFGLALVVHNEELTHEACGSQASVAPEVGGTSLQQSLQHPLSESVTAIARNPLCCLKLGRLDSNQELSD